MNLNLNIKIYIENIICKIYILFFLYMLIKQNKCDYL